MFNFFKKNKSDTSKASSYPSYPKQHILRSNAERVAIASSHFFTEPYIFAKLKDINVNRKKFIEENYFNLHYLFGTVDEFMEEREEQISDLKEGLNFGWGIVDKESYDSVLNSFKPDELEHAWDIVRIATITQYSYTVEYIDLDTAEKVIYKLGTQLIKNYKTWEKVAEDFLTRKLRFNNYIKEQDEDVEEYSEISSILHHMDFLFNDKDSPLHKVPLGVNEDLCKASDRVVGYNQSLYKRLINTCSIYQWIPGWVSHWVTPGYHKNDIEYDFLEFIDDNLELDEDERFLFAHAKPDEDPEYSDFDLLLTTKKLYIFPIDDFNDDAYYIDLVDLEKNPISFKKRKLCVEGEVVKDSIHFDLKGYEELYAELLNYLIDFIVKRS